MGTFLRRGSMTLSVKNQPMATTTNEDTATEITLLGTDLDGDELTCTVTEPTSGSVSLEGEVVTYTPAANFNGTDSFTYTVFDGELLSDEATVTIDVESINDPPIAHFRVLETYINTSLDFVLSGHDPEGDGLIFTVSSSPLNGDISGEPPNLSYTPHDGFVGLDTLEFQVSDGKLQSEVAVASFVVSETQNQLKAIAATYILKEDSEFSLTLQGSSDIDTPMVFQVLTQPSHGRIEGLLPDLVYIPDSNFYGTDYFEFKVVQSGVVSQKAIVRLLVEGINDAPAAISSQWVLREDEALSLQVSGVDLDADELSFSMAQLPSHGVLKGSLPNIIYHPELNFFGEDTWSFSVSDGNETSSPATVTMEVEPVNDPPVGRSEIITLNENESRIVELYGEDPDGDPLKFEIVSLPIHGTLDGTPPNLSYLPATNYHGEDSFEYNGKWSYAGIHYTRKAFSGQIQMRNSFESTNLAEWYCSAPSTVSVSVVCPL